MRDWLVIGVTGVTCGGKTTLANGIHREIANSIVMNQDDYFLPEDCPEHVYVPEIRHINFDIMSSLDMKKMYADILVKMRSDDATDNRTSGTGRKNLLVVEGFRIFDCKPILDLCELRYFMTLEEDACRERRKFRVYDPPDNEGYFDYVVWPEYVKYLSKMSNSRYKIQFVDGTLPTDCIFEKVIREIRDAMKTGSKVTL